MKSDPRFPAVEKRYEQAFANRKDAAEQYLQGKESADPALKQASLERYQSAQREMNDAHLASERLVGKDFHDTNYIFLSFVTRYLPAGLVGLIIAVIFSAAMSSTSGEINSWPPLP